MIEVRVRSAAPALDVAFAAPDDRVTVLFGPSGAGKSSILAAIAGALPQADVRVTVGGERIDALPPERRRIGMVHQDARLFPHMSVLRNLRYGLARARGEARVALDEVVEVLGIAHLLTRGPATLSGGERQRVALGRALLSQPRLLLLDEPLAALDARRRTEVLPFFERLRDRFGLPAFYVTHDAEEGSRLADRVLLVEDGRIAGEGGPELLPGARHAGTIVGRCADGVLLVRVEGADDFADDAAVMLRPGRLASLPPKEDKPADG